MMYSVGLFRLGLLLLLLLAGFALSGCLPSVPKDEEKEPHFLVGRTRVNTMDFKGAIESFEKALEVNPKSAAAHFELGWLYDQKESDPAAAIYHYERYLKLFPNSPKAEMVTSLIQACKQQLAQTVSLAPGIEKQQRELEQLAEENRRLREELEKWRGYALRLQGLTNQPARPLTVVRAVSPPGSGQPASSGAVSPGVTATVRTAATPTATSRTHVVKAGETPTLIARKYGVKVESLLAANPGLDPRRMHVGKTLVVPAP